ncbi:hypothetical protein EQG63_11160 [Flavobacterium amnicola]|uniref:Lipoprotein n=1 Tax=Flavobacterium amnicola TaxID=2506422 RepID=A0A4V1N1R2_9FLAO|nr:hypothetical protein [Flavobacterium amnicola]RXR17340.1 hypothetical protein EQG63_11160 [Flavobacterium amnicola]
MKKAFFLFLIGFFFISCNNKEELDLEIINNIVFVSKSKDSSRNNIITYKLTNKSNKTYCFLPLENSRLIYKIKCLKLDNSGFVFVNEKDTIKRDVRFINFSDSSFQNKLFEIMDEKSKKLGYKLNGYTKDNIDKNKFFIHPKETIYFEKLVSLPIPDRFSSKLMFRIDRKYMMSVFVYSDSTKSKDFLSRPDFKTITENGYEIYHGVIKSKNKVPIKFID